MFADDGPPSVLPQSAVQADHSRAGQIVFTLRATAAPAPSGLPGSATYDGGLKLGAGTHGGLSAAELHTVLMLAGSRIKPGGVSNWPAGLIDIAPTVLALLGVPGAVSMDGRVLGEVLEGGVEPTDSRSPETWEASSGRPGGFAQRVGRMRVGRHVWIDEGLRL